MGTMDRLKYSRKYEDLLKDVGKFAQLGMEVVRWRVSESGQEGQPQTPSEKPQ